MQKGFGARLSIASASPLCIFFPSFDSIPFFTRMATCNATCNRGGDV
jgi:hypothetical protein